jgi:hypothetical protein
MTFLDLVKIEVDYRHYAHDVSARRLVRLRHDAGYSHAKMDPDKESPAASA